MATRKQTLEIENKRHTIPSSLEEQAAWDMYFATIVGWTLHPGYQRPGTEQLDLIDAANLATQMVQARREIWQ